MGFIKLTAYDGQLMYVNMEFVRAFSDIQGRTVLNFDGANLYVKESPDAIMALMELKERGKNA